MKKIFVVFVLFMMCLNSFGTYTVKLKDGAVYTAESITYDKKYIKISYKNDVRQNEYYSMKIHKNDILFIFDNDKKVMIEKGVFENKINTPEITLNDIDRKWNRLGKATLSLSIPALVSGTILTAYGYSTKNITMDNVKIKNNCAIAGVTLLCYGGSMLTISIPILVK